VALYIDALHRRSGRQVRLQAQAFEVTLRDMPSIDWRSVRQQLGVRGNVPEAGLAADPAALRAALGAQGEVRTLWAPEITTLNNEPAMVRMSTATGASLMMTVVPQIAADGVVVLSLSHAWQESAGGSSAAGSPRSAESDTVTRVMDGNTALVAGLLRDAPATAGAGARHTELVVLLRPTVVDPGAFVADSRR
jgi:type II secretory pathway component GspD/PulD (secretin)